MGAVGKKACLIKTVDVHEILERTTSSAHSRGRGGDDAHVEPGPSNTSGLDKDGRERGKASIKKKRPPSTASDDLTAKTSRSSSVADDDGREREKASRKQKRRSQSTASDNLTARTSRSDSRGSSVADDDGREPPSSQKRRSVYASDDDEEDGPEPAKKDKRSQEKHKRGRDGGASRLAVSDEEGSSAGQSETGSSQKSVQVQPPTPVFGPLGSGT